MLPNLVHRPDRCVYSRHLPVVRDAGQAARRRRSGSTPPTSGPRVAAPLRPPGAHRVDDPDTGAYLAGVGIKHHDGTGRSSRSVPSPRPAARAWPAALVAQAARRVLDEGAVPTYQHDPANVASARVADAAGFPDRGWRSAGMP